MLKNFKRNVLVIIFILISILLTSCGSDNSEGTSPQQTLEEYQLVSCYIEIRNETNKFGGILCTDKYFHYGFLNGDQVIFDELCMLDDYGGMVYKLIFEITDENPKVIIQKNSYQNVFTFQLTQEMYAQLFTQN